MGILDYLKKETPANTPSELKIAKPQEGAQRTGKGQTAEDLHMLTQAQISQKIDGPVRPSLSQIVSEGTQIASQRELASELGVQPEVSPVEVTVKTPEPTVIPEAPKEEIKESSENEMEHFSGRIFVDKFLKQVNEILTLGKSLEQLGNERAIEGGKASVETASIKELRDNGQSIKDTLNTFLTAHDDERSISMLNKVIESYSAYIDTFNQVAKEKEDLIRKSDTEFVAKISATKKSLDKLVASVGGKENFDKVRKFIRSCENKASAILGSEYGTVSLEAKKMIANTVIEFVQTDLEGSKMLSQNGDILSILVRVFSEQKKATK